MYHLSDTEFAAQFAVCSLDPKLFTHEAHLRLAWIHVTRHGVTQAMQNIRAQIASYDNIFGDGTKYHETVTRAAVYVIDHFVQKSSSATFHDFLIEFPRLKTHFRDLLAQHYSFDIFRDDRAKTQYLEPDIEPFNM